MQNSLENGQNQMGTRNVGSVPIEWANVTPAHPFWANAEHPAYMPPWTLSTQNQRERRSFDMKKILLKQISDQQQLQDYEANFRSCAQPENRPENGMLQFQERQMPERQELRGPIINFGFIDRILKVKSLKQLLVTRH